MTLLFGKGKGTQYRLKRITVPGYVKGQNIQRVKCTCTYNSRHVSVLGPKHVGAFLVLMF